MDLQQKTGRFGICVILIAIFFRLCLAGFPQIITDHLVQIYAVSLPIYLETGRNVRFSASLGMFSQHVRESPDPWLPEEEKPAFSASDAELVEVTYLCSLRPDFGELLEKPLIWNLKEEVPTVLILHTHTTESYTQSEERYEASSSYRTLEEAHNMLCIGDAVAEILEQNGIAVLHDRQIHDYPSYNGSYTRTRETMGEYLKQYPTIQLVLDLHRDAADSGGKQLRTQTMVDGEVSAQLMFVVGTNYDAWQENLSLAAKLHTWLEQQNPGIMRPISLRSQRFNQDLNPGALLVEVGAAGNTRAEALRAAGELAEAIAAFSAGTNGEKVYTIDGVKK